MPDQPLKIIALAQGKGGSTKSASAINLACEAIQAGESAAIVDMDEGQQSAVKWGKRRDDKPPKVVFAGSFKLKEALELLRRDGTKWVFLDLPGRNAPVSSAGIVAADFVIIPTRPTTIDFEASIPTVQSCVRAKKPYTYLLSAVQPQGDKSRGRQFRVSLGLLPTPPPVCPCMIGQRIEVADALAEGKSVRELKPGGEAAKEFEELFKWLKKTLK